MRLISSQAKGILSGKSFVVTGTLQGLTRDEAKATIRSNGGQISESISAKTSYLLVGENPGSKLEKAKKLGVKIITEQEFNSLISHV